MCLCMSVRACMCVCVRVFAQGAVHVQCEEICAWACAVGGRVGGDLLGGRGRCAKQTLAGQWPFPAHFLCFELISFVARVTWTLRPDNALGDDVTPWRRDVNQ